MNDWIQLNGTNSSLVVGCPDGGVPQIGYWGARLADDCDLQQLALLVSQPGPCGFLDAIPPLSLVPELGRGFHGEAGLLGHSDGLRWGGQFQCVEVERIDQQQIRFDCSDSLAGLTLQLFVSLDASTDMIGLQAKIVNEASEPFSLDHLGVSVPLPAQANELLSFHGRWIQEFLTKRFTWPMHKVVRENHRGKTSHDSFPAFIAGQPGFNENQGNVWGLHLAYSGNHKLVAEKMLHGARHVQMAEWLYPGEIMLAQGESYQTPKIYGTWSGQGLNGLSHNFHRYLRTNILDLNVIEKPRPVHLNTWEAFYFDHKPEQLLDLVKNAAEVGVERFILDDGWFGKRDDDHAGLGDWFVDESKHPGGLGYLIDAVKAEGMEFGLWFEPEMINPDSDLFRSHPDWILQVEGYEQQLGRFQYVLNLSNPDVFDYLFERLDWFLSNYDIGYIKWDMNRDLTQPGSKGVASVHEQTQAFYRLLAKLRQAHPQVEIETCSSGGGRIDFEVLRHTQRIWTSDCIDARERQRIQKGYSLLLPPEIMGSHISDNPSHTTGRSLQLGYRLITAMFGHMGLEMNVSKFTDAEKQEVADAVKLYKEHRQLLHTGDGYRLDCDDDALQGYGVVSADKSQAIFSATTLKLQEQMFLPPLSLAGLDPEKNYSLTFWIPKGALGPHVKASSLIENNGGVFSGQVLQQVGVQLPVMNPDSAILLMLTALED
jgi:alpha-galactosidase